MPTGKNIFFAIFAHNFHFKAKVATIILFPIFAI
jgi:hypothetical protein